MAPLTEPIVHPQPSGTAAEIELCVISAAVPDGLRMDDRFGERGRVDLSWGSAGEPTASVPHVVTHIGRA